MVLSLSAGAHPPLDGALDDGSLSPKLSAYLAEGFGAEAGALSEAQRLTFSRFGNRLESVGYRAPKQSYLRGFSARTRLSYLSALLDRAELLKALPEYAALQSALGLSNPVDAELKVALETLARVPTVDSGALARLRQLQADGYRFTFPDLDLLIAAGQDPRLSRAVRQSRALRPQLERRLAGRAHAARTTSTLPEGPEALDVLSRLDLLRVSLILDALGSEENAATDRRLGR